MKYYLHDSNAFNDEKITELYIKFGYEGLGLFYTVLEKFALQEKPIKTTVLKSQLNIKKRLEKCWSFMEEIGIISSSNGDSFSKELLNFSEKYQIRKEKNAKKVAEWRLKQQNVTSYEPVSNPPKVKESKVNIHKEDVTTFFSYYLLKTKKNFRLTGANENLIKDRLQEGYTLEQLKKAVDNFILDDWADRPKHFDLIYCIGKQRGKPDALERWLNHNSTKAFIKP